LSAGIHPRLAAAFEALEEAGVEWCLLRGEHDLAAPQGDVDLLVARTDLHRASRTLERIAFRRHRAWGHGSHRFFVAYDEDEGRWLKLDIVTELGFGPVQALTIGAELACLRDRVRKGLVAQLADADAFTALLLHCILDKGDVPARHAAELTRLAEAASGGALATAIERLWPNDWNEQRARRCAGQAAWDELLRAGPGLRRRWIRRRPVAWAWRRASQAGLRKAEPLRLAVRDRGTLVALFGPDGSGKSTLATGLRESYYLPVRLIYLGLYTDEAHARRPQIVRFALRLAWLARATLTIRYHLLRGRLVVADRHPSEAALALVDTAGRAGRRRLRLLARAAPRHDAAFVLDAPAEILAERKQEHSLAELERQRAGYLALAARLPGAVVLDATNDQDRMRRRVTALLWRRD
jgi:thymidylate kinase